MAQTLAQVIASDTQARQAANKHAGQLHKDSQKHDLFAGFTRTYAPFEAPNPDGSGGVQLPAETKRVQLTAEQLLTRFAAELRPAIDWSAAKDHANSMASADVVLADGTVLYRDVPAVFLLHMEKVLEDIATFVAKLPVLPADEDWNPDPGTGLWRSRERDQLRYEQEIVPVVLHAPTKEHPAQVHAANKQVAKGTWTAVKHSGALTEARKRELESRVADMKTAFKRAREQANRTEAPSQAYAEELFALLFA